MLIPVTQKRDVLRPGIIALNGGESNFIRMGAGEGGFRFDDLTIGFVLNRVASHRGSYGSDQMRAMPLEAGMGWVLPGGVDGHCAWDEANDFINLRLGSDVLAKVSGGVPKPIRIAAQVNDPTLVQLALNLHESIGADDAVSAMYRDTMLLATAAHILKAYGSDMVETQPAAMDPRMRRAMDYIEAHLSENVSLDVLANIAAMSPFHFARSFKSATGLPPHKFLAARRMEQAKQLLKSTSLPVAEIAWRVGYENISHFTQVFRQNSGQTPGMFRAS
jgi:AraC family transcriptional regulator